MDSIWSDFDNANNIDTQVTQVTQQIKLVVKVNANNILNKCKGCGGDNLQETEYENVCCDCGLVSNENRLSLQQGYESNITPTTNLKSTNNKMSKMQEWLMWTNEEKNIYKLKNYVKDLCQKLQIVPKIISDIIDTSVFVMETIKKHDGTKRAKVKDGIILVCIQYVSRGSLSAIDLSKKLDLDIKYITKAEKMILELTNSKKLNLDKNILLQTKTPFDYIIDVIKKQNLKINDQILQQVKQLIKTCETNDLLLDHTPLSVGVCCFYYILKLYNIEIDIKMFSELYNLSIVTIVKTFNKLKSELNDILNV